MSEATYKPLPGEDVVDLLNRVLLLAAAQMVAIRTGSQDDIDHAEQHLSALPDDLADAISSAADTFEEATGWLLLKQMGEASDDA